jgi:uncharacterized protein (TIGR00730 family)
MNILIFCSAREVAEKYQKDAIEFASLVAKTGHTLVWGGSNYGNMKLVADAAQAAGGKIIGITMEPLAAYARENADEMIVTKDLGERKRVMIERSDAVVVLAGGIGTLDEAMEVLAHKQIFLVQKHLVFLDTDGFYQGLKMQLERMDREGFLKKSTESGPLDMGKLVHFAMTPEEVMQYLA